MLKKIGLASRFDCTLRIWFDTGIAISRFDTATIGYILTTQNNTFTNTYFLMINHIVRILLMVALLLILLFYYWILYLQIS
jgi:hypothetical protein